MPRRLKQSKVRIWKTELGVGGGGGRRHYIYLFTFYLVCVCVCVCVCVLCVCVCVCVFTLNCKAFCASYKSSITIAPDFILL